MVTALALLIVSIQSPAEWDPFAPGSWAEHLTTGTRDGAEVRTVEKALYKDATEREVVISLETVEAGGGRSVVDMKYPIPQREVPKEEEGEKKGRGEAHHRRARVRLRDLRQARRPPLGLPRRDRQ